MYSIIVPMFNVRQYAEQCINSILNQTYTDFELIIVDDGSTDGTSEIIDQFASKDNRIKAVHQHNGGLTSARKTGALHAAGEYVVIVDGDDWIDSDYLETIAKVIDQFHPDVVICGHTISSEIEEKQISYHGLNEGFYTSSSEEYCSFLNNSLIYSSPTVWAKCFKTSDYIRIQEKIENKISMGEDGCISYPLLASASTISVISNYGYHYRLNPTSLTRKKNKMIPFSSAIWRIKHLNNELPSTLDIDKQVAAYAGHALLNVLLTNFNTRDYREVVNETLKTLNDPIISKYFRIKRIKGSTKEKLAHYLIRNRLFFLVKAYSYLINRK